MFEYKLDKPGDPIRRYFSSSLDHGVYKIRESLTNISTVEVLRAIAHVLLYQASLRKIDQTYKSGWYHGVDSILTLSDLFESSNPTGTLLDENLWRLSGTDRAPEVDYACHFTS